jgi:ABC-type multidrug transport system fused ATPase/permease subunit
MIIPKKVCSFFEKCQPFFDILPKREKRNFYYIVLIQSFIASFDIIGIFLVGIVGVLVTNYLVDSSFNDYMASVINLFGLEKFSDKFIILIFSILVIIFFILKTFVSISMNRKILNYYANKERDFSVNLYSKLLNSPYAWIKKLDSERIHSALITGANAIFMRVIGNVVLVISDLFLLLFIFVFLAILSPLISIFTFIFFALFVLILHKVVAKKAAHYGNIYSESLSDSYTYLSALILSFREIFTMNKKQYFINKYDNAEKLKSDSFAKGLWIQLLPKYVFEIALTLGVFTLSGFLLASDVSNISLLTIFIVAAGRIVPALFRIQSCIFNLLLGYPNALIAINFLQEAEKYRGAPFSNIQNSLKNPPCIKVREVSFRFPDSQQNIIDKITFELSAGSAMALVGKSGSGKTTLVDLILNVYSPSMGEILIEDGANIISPGSISNVSYVPQNPMILKGTLLENILFGSSAEEIDEEALDYAVTAADLGNLILKLPGGLKAMLNNLGGVLSGGERQRIAIARALYQKPKLLVIDEGTSSLDITSEKFISKFLMTLKGQVTLILVAHRINTIKNVETIYFIENGKIKGFGNYESLQKNVPEFADWVDSSRLQYE